MTSNMVMILAGILERLWYSFPEANQEIEPTAKVNNVLRPVRERLKQFIEKADANPDLANGLAKKHGTEIMNLAHSFEDSMELYMLGFKSRKNGSSNRVNEKSLIESGRKLNQACNFSMASLINLADEISSGSAGQLYSYESDMVGMVDAEKDLVTALTEGTEHLKLVSICGMPGLGKTTLALKIYDDQEIELYFEARAWVSVSQQMDRRDILLKIHYSVNSDAESDDYLLPENALAECVREYLEAKSYLVVLDNMPDADAWFCLRNCFPDNEKGSRILITTQMKDAAILVGGPETHIHTMRLLTDEESSDLLWSELNDEGNNKSLFSYDTQKKHLQLVSLYENSPLAFTSNMSGSPPPEGPDLPHQNVRNTKWRLTTDETVPMELLEPDDHANQQQTPGPEPSAGY